MNIFRIAGLNKHLVGNLEQINNDQKFDACGDTSRTFDYDLREHLEQRMLKKK